MLPVIPKPPITPAQKRAALFIAGAVDLLQWVLLPAWGLAGVGFFADEGLDFVAALLLIAICGFRWQLGAVFMLELVPVVGLFPTWTALVMTIPSGTLQTQAPPVTAPPRPAQRVVVTNVRNPNPPASSNPNTQYGDGNVEDAVVVPPVQPPRLQ